MSRLTAFLLLGAMILASAASVLAFRMQINRMGALPAELWGKLMFVVQALLSPLAVFAMMCFGISFVCWTLASTKLPLNIAYPLTSLIYPVIVVSAHFLFGEALGWQRIVGIAIIMVGLTVSNMNP